MTRKYTNSELEAYLDEGLTPEEMAQVEQHLRDQPELVQQLSQINARRDAGIHTLGEIWRRHRLSCPTRQELGSFLLGTLEKEAQAYLEFHLETVGCRFCRANVDDLRAQQGEQEEVQRTRRQKYLDSSAGYFRKKDASDS